MFNALEPQPYGASPYPPTAAPQPTRSILPPPAFANTLPETEEDTEPIRQWREQQVKDIEARNAAAAAKRDEMANKAEKAIDQFYEEYNKEKEKNIRENKEEEAKFVEKLNEDIAKGSTWERITDLIGLENSRECPVEGGGVWDHCCRWSVQQLLLCPVSSREPHRSPLTLLQSPRLSVPLVART